MEIQVMNRQRRVRLDLPWLRRFATRALEECAPHSGDGAFALKKIPLVEVAIVSDAVIAKVHQDFMGIAGATDVITFEHGEIVTSAETARIYAAEHGHGVDEEVALYIIHGLLHLNGYDDTTPKAKTAMFRVQEPLWEKLRAELPR
jgi:rRNA maturation RNase YbeY